MCFLSARSSVLIDDTWALLETAPNRKTVAPMDLEDAFERLNNSSTRNPLVSRHLSQMKMLESSKKKDVDLRFGLLRLVQAHESLLYVFYKKLLRASSLSFHGYKLQGETLLTYKEIKIQGKILVLCPDHVFCDIIRCEMVVQRLGGINTFFDVLIHTPMPFLFVPDAVLNDVTELTEAVFNSPTSSSTCIGYAGSTSFVLLEPFTLQNIGLSFLCREVIEDERVCSLLCGFAYCRAQGDRALV